MAMVRIQLVLLIPVGTTRLLSIVGPRFCSGRLELSGLTASDEKKSGIN